MASEERKNETEKIRKIAEFKETLEKKIANTESELESLKILLEFVDKTLLEKGFKRAEIARTEATKKQELPPAMEYEAVVPLRTATGELLANLYMSKDSMRITIPQGKTFDIKTPPFQQFLIERVLKKMQEKDSEATGKGEIAIDKVFSYELVLDGDIIREISIRNLTEDRLRELKSSIQWTLEKMNEKVREGA